MSGSPGLSKHAYDTGECVSRASVGISKCRRSYGRTEHPVGYRVLERTFYSGGEEVRDVVALGTAHGYGRHMRLFFYCPPDHGERVSGIRRDGPWR